MAGLEHDSYHEQQFQTPQGFIDPQHRYARQRYAVDAEAAMTEYVRPETGRASSDLEHRDDKMNNWDYPPEDNRPPVPDGNSEVVLIDRKSAAGPSPVEPLQDPDIVCPQLYK